MGKTHQIILFVVAFAISCSEKQERSTDLVKDIDLQGEHHLMDNHGDTIPIGEPIPISQVQKKTASPVKSRTITFPNNHKSVPAHPHIHSAGKPKVIHLAYKPKAFTPGENGLLLPDTLPAYRKVIPASHSKPIAAAPLQMRDNAVTNVQYLSVEEGLTNNIIQCILEDSRGNLWFGSRDETLTRYDGQSLAFFQNSEHVPEHGFTHLSLLEDRRGNIWFGTRIGLCQYDGNSFTYFSNEDSYKYNGVTRLLEDRHGNIWFGTRNRGVGRFDGQSFIHYSTDEGLSDNGVTAILEDRRGQLWFGTEGGGCEPIRR